jgi:hypothetical protein
MPDLAQSTRYCLCALALALAAIALPMTASEALGVATNRALHIEAELGWLRGDLRGAYALGLADRADGASDVAKQDAAQRAFHLAAERALAIAPYQPALWLQLARFDNDDPTSASHAAAALKMAYYTAPADDAHIADRLALALSGVEPFDEELDVFARGDVRSLIAHDRVNILANVYQRLGDPGRQFIEDTVRAMRPALLPDVKGSG